MRRAYDKMAQEIQELMGKGWNLISARNSLINKKNLKSSDEKKNLEPSEIELLDKAISELEIKTATERLVDNAFGSICV